jgi:uncharacterized protein (TIGR03083 family)
VLLGLLRSLTNEDLARPTVCPGWNVTDIALHILGGDLNNLSRRRDGYQERAIGPSDDLPSYLNEINDAWVRGSRRLSLQVLLDLLVRSGEQTYTYFRSLDLFANGEPVTWAGPDAAPVWLDVAREYTERWVHQQQIRDAVGQPGLMEPRFFAPVLATFVHALPWALREVKRREGTAVQLEIVGESGGVWSGRRERDRWVLLQGPVDTAQARVSMDQDLAWHLFTKGITPAAAASQVGSLGDARLISAVLNMSSIIA